MFKGRATAQDAHEAIRPTDVLRTPESIRSYLTNDQYKLYRLIYNRFVANGGDGFYGAWRLTYDEPYFRNEIPAEHRRCPVADATQPRLMQFKTHYGDDATISAQAEGLRKTVKSF